jgi:acetylglutamate kinase
VDGVKNRDAELITSIGAEEIRAMIKEGSITGGMIPKIECALDALAGGVGKVTIMNGTRPHALLLELFTVKGMGTEVLLGDA